MLGAQKASAKFDFERAFGLQETYCWNNNAEGGIQTLPPKSFPIYVKHYTALGTAFLKVI